MKQQVTQILLAIIVVLLAEHLIRSGFSAHAVHADSQPQVASIVRAQAIERVDGQGQVRANLQVEEDGQAVFRLRKATGAIRVKLGASNDGSGLLLLDNRTEPAVHLLAQPAGTTVTLTQQGKEKRVLQP